MTNMNCLAVATEDELNLADDVDIAQNLGYIQLSSGLNNVQLLSNFQ